jgi:hypothetical protein
MGIDFMRDLHDPYFPSLFIGSSYLLDVWWTFGGR